MANGSFGLSGVPTAPSTVGTVPNNAFTPVTVAVNSVAGFQSGDLVYNINGDMQAVPNNYISTATFPIVDSSAVNVPNVNFGESQTPPVTGGYQYKGNNSAKLTNGNIVIVYLGGLASNNNHVYFKIISETGTVVVSDTLITSSAGLIGTRGTITVCGLSGGGFAVAWIISSSQDVGYAVYSSTGTLVKAAASAGFTTASASSWVGAYARPNGSFILSCIANGTVNIYINIFDATGTSILGWTDSGNSNQSNINQYEFVVRSDNTFVLIYPGAPGLYWARYTTTGSFAGGGVITSTNPTSLQFWGGASLLTNGNIIITWGSAGGTSYSQLSTSNVASTPALYTSLGSYTQTSYYARPIALSSGGYFVGYRPSLASPQIQYSDILNYIFVSSSNTILSSALGSYVYSVSSLYNCIPTFVETASAVNVIYSPGVSGGGPNTGTPNVSTQINWVRINSTSYGVITGTGVATTVATSSAQGVSGYARSASTPTSATFLASSTGNVSATSTQTTNASTLVVPQSIISSDTTGTYLGWDAACLPDGTTLVLYAMALGTALKLAVISPAGLLTNTITFKTDCWDSTGMRSSVRVTPLSDGKIVCSYIAASAPQVLQMLILSSAYSVLTTVTQSDFRNQVQTGCNIAALTNARFVLAFTTQSTGYATTVIYNSSGTLIQTPTGPTNNNAQQITVSGMRTGYLLNYKSNTSYINKTYIETSTNVFTSTTQFTPYIESANLFGMKSVTGPNGNVYALGPTGSNNNILQVYNGPFVDANSGAGFNISNVANGTSIADTSGVALVVTGYGEPVTFSWWNATTLVYYYNTSAMGIQGSTSAQLISGLSLQGSVSGAKMVGTGTTGHNVLVVVQNAAGALTYFIFNPNAYVYTNTLTSGVTPSSPVVLSPSNGVALIGVSTTSATANGTGTVQINGSVQLNSSYSATTTGQTFDFRNQATFGATGAISGRNVTLIGNV
jgi:hypothetical protein